MFTSSRGGWHLLQLTFMRIQKSGGVVSKKKSVKNSNQLELPIGEEKSSSESKKKTGGDNPLKGRYETAYTALYMALQIFLTKKGLTAEQLAEKMGGVSVKTVKRHMESMEFVFHIYPQRVEGKTVYMVHDDWKDVSKQSEVLFSCLDTIGLMQIQDYMFSLKSSTAVAPIRKAIRNILDKMPAPIRDNYQRMKKTFFARLPQASDYSGKEAILATIHEAALTQHRIEIDYSSYTSNRRLVREVHPYGITTFDGSFYLHAFDQASKEERCFKLDRIHTAKVLKKTFERSGELDFSKRLQDSFGIFTGDIETVTAIFDAKVATFIKEKKLHESQTLKELPDGRLQATWKVAGTREIKTCLMGFCEHVEVVEPKALRNEIARDISRMLQMYNPSAIAMNPANVGAVAAQTRYTTTPNKDEARRLRAVR